MTTQTSQQQFNNGRHRPPQRATGLLPTVKRGIRNAFAGDEGSILDYIGRGIAFLKAMADVISDQLNFANNALLQEREESRREEEKTHNERLNRATRGYQNDNDKRDDTDQHEFVTNARNAVSERD